MTRRQQGFTLIEIAIVLVIIGLLLGGVLKGQELITSARVRNLISMQDGTKAAVFGFLDRYRALPGDYSQASANINNVAAGANGNNNGQVRSIVAGDVIDEHIASWDHLSKSGFINGNYTYNTTESPTTTPTNPFGSAVRYIFDAIYEGGAAPGRHNLKTGANISSDLMAEVDRKIDDGLANGGNFRYSSYGSAAAGSGTCWVAATGNWQTQNPISNCGAASLF